MAPSYIQDKVTRDDTEILELDSHRFQANLLRLRVYSRHRNRTTYQLWIRYRNNNHPTNEDGIIDEEPILGYYCTCKKWENRS